MILSHDTARQMINVEDARITGIVDHEGERYYSIDNLIKQRTDHVLVGDNFFDDYVQFFNLLPE